MDLATKDRGVDRIAVAIVVTVMVGVAAISLTAAAPGPRYLFVHQLREPVVALHRGAELRVHGIVMPGTIERHGDYHQFVLGSRGARLRVQMHGPLPDAFRDQLEVVVRGRIASDGTGWRLDGESLLARCADKYDAGPRTLDTRYQ